MQASGDACEIAVVLPCLNEAATVGICVSKAIGALRRLGVRGEVIVADNGSSDGSAAIARRSGARVVEARERGYGSALMCGIEAARAPLLIMADADDSYDLNDLERFLVELRGGADLVMGTRMGGPMLPGAMPWLHRWIGNPLLTGLLNILFRAGVSDAHCGMRGFTKEAYRRMKLQTTGMEFASEMVIKAARAHMRIREIPITLHPDGRNRPPHLRTFRDGWRHLRFMLLLAPTWLFVWPGLACMLLGLLPLIALSGGPRSFGGYNFGLHYIALGSLLTVLGFQILTTGLCAKIYADAAQLDTADGTLSFFLSHLHVERGLAIGAILFLSGLAIDVAILFHWLASGRGALDAMRSALQASTLMIVGAQTILFFLLSSMLVLPRRAAAPADGATEKSDGD